MSTYPESVKLVEVGPRDGLQNEKQTIPAATKVEFIDRLSASGLRTIEVTSFVSPKWIPQLADAAEVFAGIDRKPGVSYPVLVPNEIAPGQSFTIGSIPVTVFDQDHGYVRTLGFRFGDVAYSTDVTALPEASFDALKGVRVWIVDALAEHDHPTHAHVDKALDWIERVTPERAVLTHMSVWLDYDALVQSLPERVEPAHDGLVIEA